jgi:hypothetical protein
MASRISDVRVPSVAANTTTATAKLKLLPIKPNITLPPKLGRPPTAADLIIKRTFDGITPLAAAKLIKAALTGRVAAENKPLVDTTVDARVRDMQVALNNVFTKGTPNRQFLESQQPAHIAVLGSLSSSNPIVYKVTKPGNDEPKYFTKSWGGGFVEMPKPPIQVVMEGRISLDPPMLRMTYPAWTNKALAGKLTTITEG